ncbi:HS12B-like protein [Mya arenaria]|uniref:HS12B-like protein n=1 Tax=Mya arenaria TaxID=6604 RepID=A0ABY7FYQ6_MYAAR|nr:HS12B-like protein [Mya arenaria]
MTIQAGLDENRITLALKPESASNWCETLDVDTKAALAGTGTQYMVIDLGGGTADISIHKKSQGGTLKGIHQPTGGPWGGIYIDVSNIKFLELVFGEKAITALKTEEIADYFDVIREFETKKHASREPRVRDRPGCELLGKLVTELTRDIPLSELANDTTFMFGGTELLVKKRVIKTGQEEILKHDCLK